MSGVKKTAKASLYVFSFFVILLIGAVAVIYVNMGSIAKQISERVASDALGVAVTIGNMDISLENKTVVVSNIRIANPPGYQKPHALTVGSVTVSGESFSRDLLKFSNVAVDKTDVYVEVTGEGTNLNDLKARAEKNTAAAATSSTNSQSTQTQNSKATEKAIKVIVKKFSLTKAQLHPSVTLIGGDLSSVTVPDIHLTDIGEKENGVLAQDAVSQIMKAVLAQFNNSAGAAGFLKGLSVDALKDMGLSTLDSMKDKLKEQYNVDGVKDEVKDIKKNLDSLKGLFQ